MFIEDDEKEGRKAALKKLRDVMKMETSKKFAKPVGAAISIEEIGPAEMGEEEEELGDEARLEDEEMEEAEYDDEAPSDEMKMMIEKLYHKFCM